MKDQDLESNKNDSANKNNSESREVSPTNRHEVKLQTSPENSMKRTHRNRNDSEITFSLAVSNATVKVPKKSTKNTSEAINSISISKPIETERMRSDRYGTKIIKENKKKIKVTFIDDISKKQNIIEVVEIEKRGVNPDHPDDKVRQACCSCLIF